MRGAPEYATNDPDEHAAAVARWEQANQAHPKSDVDRALHEASLRRIARGEPGEWYCRCDAEARTRYCEIAARRLGQEVLAL